MDTVTGTVTVHPSTAPQVSLCVLGRHGPEALSRCLSSVARGLGRDTPVEVLVLLTDPGSVGWARRHLRGARVEESAVDLGLVGGYRHLARLATPGTGFLALLDDSLVVTSGWLDTLLAAATALPHAGVVAARVLAVDGRLAEAGRVLWGDGTTTPVGACLGPVPAREWLFRRRSEVVSLRCALVRRAAWDAVGGLDHTLHPGGAGGAEDVALGLALADAGWESWVEPAAAASEQSAPAPPTRYATFLRGRELGLLRSTWADVLAGRPDPAGTGVAAAVPAEVERARGTAHRVLVVDDRLPDPGFGAGYPRAFDLLAAVAGLPGVSVSLFGTERRLDDPVPVGRLGVRTLSGSGDDLLDHLRAERFDLVIVSRPNNWGRFAAAVRQEQPDAVLVYDAEALFHVRIARRGSLGRLPWRARRALHRAVESMRAVERGIAREADHVVVISDEEAEFFRSVPGHCPISWVPAHDDVDRLTSAPASARADVLLTAGWAAGARSPNGDGLRWFLDTVWPRVLAELPWAELHVTGDRPPAELLPLASPTVRFVGHVGDLAQAYDGHRVAVTPMRYGAGVKLKTTSALQHGVPVVSTTVGAEGIGLGRGDVVDVTDDPSAFAVAILRLLTDDDHWTRRRAAIEVLLGDWAAAGGTSWSSVLADLLPAGRPDER